MPIEKFNNMINEVGKDGWSISDDEGSKREELKKWTEEQFDLLIATIEQQSDEIGGGFRGPGIRNECFKIIKQKSRKLRVV